ncbi:MAG: nucleoside deaminase [Rickettsiaceae bacterium]|nr:nucleoside deaminase [Rickettsiaceae bacterium]
MNLMLQTSYMKLALGLAELAMSKGEVPVGAIIIHKDTGEILSKAHNQVESDMSPIHHAEILALQRASQQIQTKYLYDYDMYVTLEPCILCASAISMFRVGRLYFGALDPKLGAVESVAKFFTSQNCFHKPEIYSGINSLDASLLLKEFFANIRASKKT